MGFDFKPARFLEQLHPHDQHEKQHDPHAQHQSGLGSNLAHDLHRN